MKMTIGAAMAMALMLALPATSLAQANAPAPPNDAVDISANAVDTAAKEANDASNTAIDAARDASDAAGDTIENSTDAANRAADGAENRADDTQQANDDLANRADDDRNANLDDDAELDNETPKLDDDGRSDAEATADLQPNLDRFTDDELNAPWRFVERDGVWWYRTPMNTWMTRQGGEWQAQPYSVGYRGADNRGASSAQYYPEQHGQPSRQGQQAYYNDGYQGAQQTAHHEGDRGWGEDHPSVGQQEWMCIDGRRQLVTIVSVTPVAMEGGQYYPERAVQNQGSNQPMPAAPQDDQGDQGDPNREGASNNRLTPPPVPQPNDDANKQSSDHPKAPTRQRLQESAANASGQPYSAAKPVTDAADSDAATASDTRQVPPAPQPTYQSGQAIRSGESNSRSGAAADGSYEGAADRNAGRIEATNIRDGAIRD